jgi:hypothetical protein
MNPERSQYLAAALAQMSQQPVQSPAQGFAQLAATALLANKAQRDRDQVNPATPGTPDGPQGWMGSPLGRAVTGQAPAPGQAPYHFAGVDWGGAANKLKGLFSLGAGA